MNRVRCQCGCRETAWPNQCSFVDVPGTTQRATIHNRHVDAWLGEMNMLAEIRQLMLAGRHCQWSIRWRVGRTIEQLRYAAALRIHGRSQAKKIARRTRILYLLPIWVTELTPPSWTSLNPFTATNKTTARRST